MFDGLTAPWHRRSADEVLARYGGRLCSWDAPPEGIVALPVPPAEESQVALFLPAHGALVLDEILATVDGVLTVCPSPGLADRGELAGPLDALCALPVELVLPAHGEPVVERAHEALNAAVARYAATERR